MDKPKVIVVPTDFSEVCDNAVHHAVELAKKLNYKVTLLHVIDKTTKSDLKKEQLGLEAVDEELKAIADKYSEGNNIEIDYISREGTIFKTIPEVTDELHAELMVLGTHGKVGIQHFTGSWAFKLVTWTKCPTIVVQKRAFDNGYNDIVFPIDNISEVRQKVQWAIKVAKTFNAKIHIYQVAEEDEYLADKLRIIIKQIVEMFERHKVKYVHEYGSGKGPFHKQVISYATSTRSDLVMIMSDRDMFDFIITPTEEKLIFNESQIPVMCINPVMLDDIVYQF